jgi:hypothetical protein
MVTVKDLTDAGVVIARSLPGKYTIVSTPERKRHQLVNFRAAGEVGTKTHGSVDKMLEYVTCPPSQWAPISHLLTF